MVNVVPFPQPKATFTFDVTFERDDEGAVWTAVCDDLHIATEADTYEALVQRVWEIAPEMAMENGLHIPEANLRLVFRHDAEHRLAL